MSSTRGDKLKKWIIVIMGVNAVMTVLGGLGTACVAWSADQYGNIFAVFVPSMPLYQAFAFINVFTGMVAIAVTYGLVRGDKWAYKGALITLGIAAVVAVVQAVHSAWLQELAVKGYLLNMPASMRCYLAAITIVLFLIVKRRGADFATPWGGKGTQAAVGGLTVMLAGIATITTPLWAAPRHITLEGANLINIYEVPLMVGGGLLLLVGTILLIPAFVAVYRNQAVRLFYRKLRYARQGSAHTG